MSSLQRKIVTPESLLIEKTALEFAATFWEAGRSQGLKSKYPNARAYAKRYLVRFIPLAVNHLMDILANPQTPEAQRSAIYDAFLERANDKDLSNTIPVFDNPLAATFVSDKVIPQSPLVINSPNKKKKNKGRLEDLPLDQMLYQGSKIQ